MPILQINELSKFPEVRGVFVGGCVQRGDGSRFRALAHAHTHEKDLYHRWICVLSQKRVFSGDKLSQLMLHEIAHIITGEGHTDKWRAKAREIGYRLPRRYWPKKKVTIITMKHVDGRVTKVKGFKRVPFKG